jgi:hypothetical protein
MEATAGLSLTLDPLGKIFQNASSRKPLGQLKPNCPGMIIGRSSTKFLFFMPIGNPRRLEICLKPKDNYILFQPISFLKLGHLSVSFSILNGDQMF